MTLPEKCCLRSIGRMTGDWPKELQWWSSVRGTYRIDEEKVMDIYATTRRRIGNLDALHAAMKSVGLIP